MTPDERADRAERVITETVAHYRELAAWFARDKQPFSLMVADVLTNAADALGRNARIAGIVGKDKGD